jgi:intracellular sulfur oxidation DsrE/DsrF family protein
MRFKVNTVVFYSNDIDGATSSWVYNKKDPSEDVKYIRCDQDENFSSYFFKKCQIYFIGVCPDKELYLNLRKGNNNRVVIFNNDASCKNQYERFLNDPDLFFHTSQTCNQSMWKYYFSEEEIPEGVNYVNDALQGANRLPDSGNVLAYLENKDLDHNLVSQFVEDMSNIITQEKIVREGKIIKGMVDRMIKEISGNHYLTEISGYKVPIVCCNKSLGHRVAQEILGDYPFSCAFYFEDGIQKLLLRSNKGGVDVSQIAKSFGGHGMPRFASISINRREYFIT